MSALRSPCLITIVRSGRPLARAASMKSDDEHLDHGAAGHPRGERDHAQGQRNRGQHQVAELVEEVGPPRPNAGSTPSQTANTSTPRIAVK